MERLLLSNSHYFPVGKTADVGRERRGGSKIMSKKEKERHKNNGTKNEMCCLHCFFLYVSIHKSKFILRDRAKILYFL